MNRQNTTNIPAVIRTIPIIADRPDGIHPDYMVNSGASVARTMNSYPGSPAAKEAAREEIQRLQTRERLDDFAKQHGYAGMTRACRNDIMRALAFLQVMLGEVA